MSRCAGTVLYYSERFKVERVDSRRFSVLRSSLVGGRCRRSSDTFISLLFVFGCSLWEKMATVPAPNPRGVETGPGSRAYGTVLP